MSDTRHRPVRLSLLVVLLLTAGIPRLLAAFLLPNEEGDPYAYVQAIDMMRASLVNGTFTISELFGFWLPLYQFVCALITVLVGHPLYVAKVFSAVCGIAVCLLVFRFSELLTSNRMFALLAFGLIALNPIHIMYSAFSMSDVPHALLVIGSLYFAIKDRWILASILVALGGLMRPESWVFILLFPALQLLIHRRVSLTSVLITLSAPLVWIYISWSATGNVFEYFDVRRNYILELLAKDPSLGSLSPAHVVANLQTLLYSTGHAILFACLIAGWLSLRRVRRSNLERGGSSSMLLITLAYFFTCLVFLLFAYLSKNQPAIFARYCLILFALGLPVFAWTLSESRNTEARWPRAVAAAAIALCAWQWSVQFLDSLSYVGQVSQKRVVANYLKTSLEGSPQLRAFCDDDTIKTLTGLPLNRFVSSSVSPFDSKSFLEYLKANRVEFLLYERRAGSAVQKAFSDLDDDEIRNHFQLVASTTNEMRLYRASF